MAKEEEKLKRAADRVIKAADTLRGIDIKIKVKDVKHWNELDEAVKNYYDIELAILKARNGSSDHH